MKKQLALFIPLVTLLFGCNQNESINQDADLIGKNVINYETPETEQTITDQNTVDGVEKITIEENDNFTIINDYPGEDMEKVVVHDYLYFTRDIIIDTEYSEKDITRGDVVYYNTPNPELDPQPKLKEMGSRISRIIALPGERIKIEKGQIYIDDSKLDTFYGAYRNHGGVSFENFEEISKIADWTEEMKREIWNELETITMSEITVPEGHVYVIDDNWFRPFDSKTFGPLPQENINGEVIAVKE